MYVNALKNYDIIFGVGPAGSGKTYLAVIYAVWLLKNHKIYVNGGGIKDNYIGDFEIKENEISDLLKLE